MFADDMVIFGTSREDLQNSSDRFYSYCDTWGLSVNTDKTQVVVFRKRGRLRDNEIWYYNGKPLSVVSDFNYLGVVFNYTGSFTANQQYLSGKALKAMNVLRIRLMKFDLKPKDSLQLFDTFISSLLNYGSPIWGFTKSKELERLHLKFLKSLLGVKASTSNAGVYIELGRYPLFINRYVAIIKYWFKLLCTNNIILRHIYSQLLDDCCKGVGNWLKQVKDILCNNGYLYVWENPWCVDQDKFPIHFKQRLIDIFIQSVLSELDANRVLTLYKVIKLQFDYAPYLDLIRSKFLRIQLTKLRLSSHLLRIESGRYERNRLDRSLRTCQICNTGDIEDEYHFILIRNQYLDLRVKYIKRFYYKKPSMYKLISLLQSSNHRTLFNLSLFLKDAFHRRTSN